MKIPVGVSNRHVHLTKETYEILFGDSNITKRNDLTQPNEFASESLVSIKNGDKEIKNVRILGPFRKYNQVEISATDARGLRLNPPVRKSGELVNAAPITIIGPNGEVDLKSAAIIAERHFHIDPIKANELNIIEDKEYQININTIKKGSIFAKAKYLDDAYFELHLDTDDANAFLLANGDEVELFL